MTTVASRSEARQDARPNPASQMVDRVRARWAGMAGRIGMFFCGLGFVVIGFAWNGAASNGVVERQMPYLVSGGLLGLSFVIIGGSLIVAESNRRDRAVLEQQLLELTAAVERLSAAGSLAGNGSAAHHLDVDDGIVVAGRSSYHAPGCRLVEGRRAGTRMTTEAAEAAGLTACRVCGA